MADDLRLGERFDMIVGQRRCVSDLQEITAEGTMVLSLPTHRGTPVLVETGDQIILVYYRATGMFTCTVKVTGRRKDDAIALIEVEITSPIKKYQRRDFVRFETAIPISIMEIAPPEKARTLSTQQIVKIANDRKRFISPEELRIQPVSGITLDISGGGARISCAKRFERQTLLECTFDLDGKTPITLMTTVLRIEEVQSERLPYQLGVTFVGIDEKTRKVIIRYIFEEQSKRR